MSVEEYLRHFAKVQAKARRLNRLSLREINLEIRKSRRERLRAATRSSFRAGSK